MTTASGHTADTAEAPRTPIGKVVATVEFDLYEGDRYTNADGTDKVSWPWFEYAEPGVTRNGDLGVCRRECRLLSARVSLATEPRP